MNYSRALRAMSDKPTLATFLIIAIILWTVGLSVFFNRAHAATVSLFSATASSTAPGVNTNYTIQWTAATALATGETIKISFDPGNNTFDLGSLTTVDVLTYGSPTGLTITTSPCGAVTADQVSINGGISNSSGNKSITLTACGAVASGAKTISFINNHVTNPSSQGSYVVRVAGTQTDSGDTRVAIVNLVTLSAAVETSFVFSVTGLASGQTVNGETTSTTTTATAIEFGELLPTVPVIGGQELTVVTNAVNGFAVTMKEDQNLTSSAGGQIYTFKDGAGTSLPLAWATPTGTIGNALTYGHIGITSDDADLNGGEFTGSKYAGDFATTTRVIFSNSGASDGVTQNIGKARVAYKIQITALQAAGNDYTAHFIYVCTPTF